MKEFLELLVLVVGLALIAAQLAPTLEQPDALIDDLIDHNRATPRPGMAGRDDRLMLEAEARAAAKRGTV